MRIYVPFKKEEDYEIRLDDKNVAKIKNLAKNYKSDKASGHLIDRLASDDLALKAKHIDNKLHVDNLKQAINKIKHNKYSAEVNLDEQSIY